MRLVHNAPGTQRDSPKDSSHVCSEDLLDTKLSLERKNRGTDIPGGWGERKPTLNAILPLPEESWIQMVEGIVTTVLK